MSRVVKAKARGFRRSAFRKKGEHEELWGGGGRLDRLGRSLRDLITMLDELKQRGVKFRSLTEHIDTDTPTGRAMWQMIGLLAELERSLISERTRAGVKAAKRRGVKFGRKPKLTPQQLAHARELIDKGDRDRQGIADLFKVSRTTLYRALVA
jgi:DNA invertase Pin-like site-specific DNA recombinase